LLLNIRSLIILDRYLSTLQRLVDLSIHSSCQTSIRNIQLSNNNGYQEPEKSTLIGLGWSLLCPIIFKAPGMRLVRTTYRNIKETKVLIRGEKIMDRYAKRGSKQKLQRLCRPRNVIGTNIAIQTFNFCPFCQAWLELSPFQRQNTLRQSHYYLTTNTAKATGF